MTTPPDAARPDDPAAHVGRLHLYRHGDGRAATWVLLGPRDQPLRAWPADLTRDDVGALLLEAGLLLDNDDLVRRL